MKKAPIVAALASGLLTVAVLHGQFEVHDGAQQFNALRQIAQEVQELAKLDSEILTLEAEYAQIQYNASHFTTGLKSGWLGTGNRIVSNWTTPNYYGETAAWQRASALGSGNLEAWQQAVIALQRNPYLAGQPIGNSRDYSYTASVNTFDSAGPTALQTLGNARVQQTQMAAVIARLQAAAMDGSAETNSEVQQLNLLTAGSVQNLQMQQTANNTLVSLLEQQTIANKIQRDTIADHMNFMSQMDQYSVSEPYAWGNAAEAISGYRMRQ